MKESVTTVSIGVQPSFMAPKESKKVKQGHEMQSNNTQTNWPLHNCLCFIGMSDWTFNECICLNKRPSP